MSHVIGIDLGTTNSVVAVMEGGSPKVIANQEGSRTTPSVVGFGESEGAEVLVGQVARRQAITNPANTVYSIKRFMGHRFSEVASEQSLVPYELVQADNGDAAVKIRNRRYSPPEIAAKVLAKLRQAAEEYLGQEVSEAVVTVPAYFNDAQRSATRDAAVIAGLNVKRLVNEPTAAALAYNVENKEDKLIAIYDFGGGTFDISILEIGEKVVEVRSTAGDTLLGGDNIDQLIIDYLIREFKNDTEIDVSEDRMVLQRLKEAAEKAKIELSSTFETDINLPFLTADASGPKHLNIRMSRAKLEHLIGDLVAKTLIPCKQAIDDAGLRVSEIEDVILVGGSTRIPLVMEKVEEFFGHPPAHRVNPDEVVALGAAVQGAVLSGEIKDMLLLDVTPLSLGVETRGGVMAKLIERNTTIPVKRAKTFTTAVDNQAEVEIHVLQGERDFVKDNRSLGKFTLTDIAPATRATPKIEVAFDIDANGIVNVSATDKGTGRKQEITVQPSGGLAEGEIRRLLEEAEKAAETDKERRKTVEARNRLDGLIHSARRKAADLEADGKFEEEVRALRQEIATATELLADLEADLEGVNRIFDALGVALANLETAVANAKNAAEAAAAKEADDTAGGEAESGGGAGEAEEAASEEGDGEAESGEADGEPEDAVIVEDPTEEATTASKDPD